MNLPQRKKSAEEIAKLREELGVFAQPPAPQAIQPENPARSPAATAPLPVPPLDEKSAKEHPEPPDFLFSSAPLPSSLPAVDQLPTPGINPLPSALAPRGPKPVSSLRKSERFPTLPVSTTPTFQAISGTNDQPIVRSLRKSEQGPVTIHKPVASEHSHLPTQRRTDAALNEIRRRDALEARFAPPPPKLTAPLPLVISGYLLSLTSVGLAWFEINVVAPAACEALVLLIALFILIRKPQSRHHAAFMAILALLVIIFGTLHYFPNLRYVP